jgi:hypothetical protein
MIKNQLATNESRMAKLESQMADVQLQNQAFNKFLLDFDMSNLDNFVKKNAAVNVLDGQLEAGGIVAGAFTVKVKNESSATIGKSSICKDGKALQSDGTCAVPADGSPVSDGKSMVIKTTSVTADSKIFVTSKVATLQPLAVTEIVPGVSFKVEVKDLVTDNLQFDWFIVEEK